MCFNPVAYMAHKLWSVNSYSVKLKDCMFMCEMILFKLSKF